MRIWMVAVCALVALGCRTVNPPTDVLSSQATPVPQKDLWDVAWVSKLTPPSVLEYAPREFATPAIDSHSGNVIVGTRDGMVRAVSSTSGDWIWSFEAGASFNSGGLIHDGCFFVGSSGGSILALKAATGAVLWRYETKEEIGSTPILTQGKLLVRSMADTLFVLDSATGRWLWQYRRDLPAGFTIRGVSEPTVVENQVFLGFSDGALVALDLADGSVIWERNLASSSQKFRDVDASIVWQDETRLFAASYGSGMSALNPKTGDQYWSNGIVGLTSISKIGDVLLGAGDNVVAAFSADDGHTIWTQSLDGAEGRAIRVDSQLAWVPTGASIVMFDVKTGQRVLKWNPGAGVSSRPLRHQNRMYVLTNHGALVALDLKGQKS